MTTPQTLLPDAPGISSAHLIDLRQRVFAYARKHHTMTLATDGPEGICATTVFYVNVGLDWYFVSSTESRHGRNLAANSRIAATIHDDVQDWKAINGLQLEGTVERVLDPKQRYRLLKAFLGHFPVVEKLWGEENSGDDLVVTSTTHGLYRIHPDRLYFMDHDYESERRVLTGDQLKDQG